MKLMEDRISQDAIIEDGEILKVGSFLNQQIDVPFISRCAEEFHRLFAEHDQFAEHQFGIPARLDVDLIVS